MSCRHSPNYFARDHCFYILFSKNSSLACIDKRLLLQRGFHLNSIQYWDPLMNFKRQIHQANMRAETFSFCQKRMQSHFPFLLNIYFFHRFHNPCLDAEIILPDMSSSQTPYLSEASTHSVFSRKSELVRGHLCLLCDWQFITPINAWHLTTAVFANWIIKESVCGILVQWWGKTHDDDDMTAVMMMRALWQIFNEHCSINYHPW